MAHLPSHSQPATSSALGPRAAADALRTVIDPELGIDIVALGLVYGVRVDLRRIEIKLTMTTPACPVIGYILQEVEAALHRLSDEVHVDLVWSPPWSPAMLAPEVRAGRGLRTPFPNRKTNTPSPMSHPNPMQTDLPVGVADAPCVDLDVRPLFADGQQPCGVIVETAAGVPPGHVFRLRAPFKPVPLFTAMGQQGWGAWVDAGAGDDWTVCFYRESDFA